MPPGPEEVGIAEELARAGRPEKGAERHPEDTVGIGQIGFGQRPDHHGRYICHCFPPSERDLS
jgi:hypothetical protein